MLDNKLYTFLKVIELGGFSKAAAELNLTQSAVSQQISHLEDDLGVTLLIRKHGTFALTPQGEIAFRYAQNLTKAYRGIWAEFEDLERNFRHIVVGITPVAQSYPIVDVIAQYSAASNNLKFSMYEAHPDKIVSLVQTGTMSWGIVDSMKDAEMLIGDLKAMQLDCDPLVCVMAPTHPLAREEEIPFDALFRERMLLPQPKFTTTELLAEALSHTNRTIDELQVILETDDIAALKRYVAEGLGISILPSKCCKREHAAGELVLRPIHNLTVSNNTWIVYREGNRDLDILQSVIGDGYWNEE